MRRLIERSREAWRRLRMRVTRPDAPSHVHFDHNGVASVDASYLLRQPHVQEQYKAARRIVERGKRGV